MTATKQRCAKVFLVMPLRSNPGRPLAQRF